MNDLFKNTPPAYLTDRQLLESIYTMLCHSPEKKTDHKATGGAGKPRHEYPEEFETLWKAYPKRSGSNPKWRAQQCWRARQKETLHAKYEQEQMMEGVARYSAWVIATGKVGTETIMQCVRFLGTGREYENAWDLPAPEVIKIPTEINALIGFASGLGLTARPGESTYDFRQRVENAI